MSYSNMLRSTIREMHGYAPGEQPRGGPIVKLNTNENPYPPSPKVFAALRSALTGDVLRKYPDPTGLLFRQTAGRVLGVDPESILIGNGSDDLLTILVRAFVPEGGLIVSPTPSYSLYASLAEIQGARFQRVPFVDGWKLPDPWPLRDAHLTFVPNPNSPSGTLLSAAELGRLADQCGPLVIDEAYVDFAPAHALELAKRPNVIVTRTLSKSYSLAGIRFGYAVADPALVRELVKVKDSYNCDALSLAAAAAALSDQEYLNETRAKILATRTRLAGALESLGFAVTPSHANFVWCQHERAQALADGLKERQILVRSMSYAGYGAGLRFTVGSDAETDRLLQELTQLL